MLKKENIRSYTAEEIRALRETEGSQTDWKKVDAITEDELERLIAEDEGEAGFEPDWTKARLVMPEPKQSIHLRLDQDVVRWFKAQGKGYQTRMNAVLKAYVDSQKQ